MRFRRGDNEFGNLERQLRAERTEPSAGLQRAVFELTSVQADVRPRAQIRLAAAGALTLALLATAGVLGTTSYAGNGGGHDGGNNQGGQQGNHEGDDGSSDSQYGEKESICHHPGKKGHGVTLRLSHEGAKAQLREHPQDTRGPCRD